MPSDTDLTEQTAAGATKITGASAAGVEDNYLDVDANGAAKTTIRDPSSGTAVTTTTNGAHQRLDADLASEGAPAATAPTTANQIAGTNPFTGKLQVPNVDANGNQYNVLTSPNGLAAGIFAHFNPAGSLNVSSDSSAIFSDPFDGGSLDTTNHWNAPITANGATFTVPGQGELVVALGTTASAKAILSSQPTFIEIGINFAVFGFIVQIEATPLINVERFWGQGTTGSSYASPLTDAVGFELVGSVLSAVVYASGTKIFSQALTAPTDGGDHRYAVETGQGEVFWYIDNFTTSFELPAAFTALRPNTETLPILIQGYNNNTPPLSGPTFNLNGVAVSDSGPNSTAIGDGTYKWRKAKVNADGTMNQRTFDGFGNPITSDSPGTAGNQRLHVAFPDTTVASVALDTNGASITIALAGLTSVGIQLSAGTFIGTITPKCSLDGGVTFVNCAFYSFINASSSTSFSFTIANPITVLSILPIAGSSHAQVVVTNYVSGTANAVLRASQVIGPVSSTSTIEDAQTFSPANIISRNELRVATGTRLIGSDFIGSMLDTNTWTATSTGSGTYTLGGGIMQLSPGTTANSSEFLAGNNRARHVSGSITAIRVAARLGDTGVANNVRRWGGYNSQDGLFFQLNGTTVGLGIRNTASDTIITSFNGLRPFVLDTNYHTYEIQYSVGAGTAYFYQDGNLIHTYSTLTGTLSSNSSYYLGFETTNSGGGTSNASLYIRDTAIMRYGEADVKPRYFHPLYTAKVQSTTGSTNGAAASLVIPITSSNVGDLIVVTAASEATTLTITDNLSQVYSTATTQTSSAIHLYTFYIANTAARVTSITLTPASSDRVVGIVTEYNRIIAVSPLDKTSTNSQAGVTSWISNATATTTQAVELLIGSALSTTHNNNVFTAGSGWTATNTIDGIGGGNTLTAFQEDQYVIATGAYDATGTNGTSDTILSSIATFAIVTSTLSNGLTLINNPTIICIGPGSLRKVIINTSGTGSASVTFYDNTTNSGQVMAVVSLTAGQNELEYNLEFNNGLTMVVNSSTADFTVVYD